MTAAPFPDNEEQRKKALDEYQVLDTAAEAAFEDIVRLASALFKTPTALVSLVDSDRQWFKARVGFDASQTPRNQSFCAHALLKPGEVLVVPDASKDPRFANNPLVTGDPNIRFYAGAPLVTATGEALGTLCVIDRQPRRLLPEQEAVLRALSRQVMAQFEMRRSIGMLEAAVAGSGKPAGKPKAPARDEDKGPAGIDPVTGLKSRRAIELALEQEVARAGSASLSLLLLDVDFFGAYQEEHGAADADEVLRLVAGILRGTLRPFDILGRFIGERFAAILPVTDEPMALVLAERCRRAVQRSVWPHRPISATLGIATLKAGQDGAGLLEAAHRALYRAQSDGRNRTYKD